MNRLQLFISSVSDEFGSYRQALRDEFDLPNVTVKVQEQFIAGGTETLLKLDDYIRHCEAVIHIAGDMTGYIAASSEVDAIATRHQDLVKRLPALREHLAGGTPNWSYTQWEAYLAIYHKKILIIAVPDASAQRDTNFKSDPAQQAAQQAHLDRLRALGRHAEIRFSNVDKLTNAVWRSKLHSLLPKEATAPGSTSIIMEPFGAAGPLDTNIRPESRFRDSLPPYMLDRVSQRTTFVQHICAELAHSDDARRPCVFLLVAPDEECPDKLIDILIHEAPRRIGEVHKGSFDWDLVPVTWPDCGSTLRGTIEGTHLPLCLSSLGDALMIPGAFLGVSDPSSFRQKIVEKMSAMKRSAVLLSLRIQPDRWTAADEDLVNRFLLWWNELKLRPGTTLPIVVATLIPPPLANGLLGWGRKKADVQQFVKQIDARALNGLRLVKLEPLDGIYLQDINNWIQDVLEKMMKDAGGDIDMIRRAAKAVLAPGQKQSLSKVASLLEAVLQNPREAHRLSGLAKAQPS